MAGSQLAWRALKWGSFFAVAGFSTVCVVIWKASGAKDVRMFKITLQFVVKSECMVLLLQLSDFRAIAGRKLPTIPKRPLEEQDRNDFKTVRELVQYYIDRDDREKNSKKSDSKPP